MAIDKLSSTPSLIIPTAAGAAQTDLPVQPSSFQALPVELQTHVFTCLPIGEYFRCMLVSTQWQNLVIALPGKRHDKFKMVVGILKEANALLPQVKAEMAQGRQLTFTRAFLPLAFRLDMEWVGAAQLVGIDELIWVFAGGDSAKRDAVLRREVVSATSSEDLHQHLALLEVAREHIDPALVTDLLHRAKEETLLISDTASRKEALLRTVKLSLELEPLTETRAFLRRESTPQLKTQSIFQVAKRELQQFNTRYQTSGIIREVFLAFQLDFEGGVEFIEIMISYDLRAALLYMNLILDPKDRLLAMEAIFRRVVNQDLPKCRAMVEENPNLLFQLLGWLAIAKREWELGLPSAQETLEKVVLEQVPPEYHDLFLQRISRVKAIMNIDSSLTTVRLIQNDAMRLDALLYLAQLIAQ